MTNSEDLKNDLFLGKKLFKLRQELGYKQQLMAEKLGLKKQQEISLYERGQKHFTEAFILKICNTFKLNVNEFKNTQQDALPNNGQSNHLLIPEDFKYLPKLVETLEENVKLKKIVTLFQTKKFLEEELKLVGELINALQPKIIK